MCLLSFAGFWDRMIRGEINSGTHQPALVRIHSFWDRMIRGEINSLYKLRGHLVVPMDNKVTAHFLLYVNRKMQKET